MASPSETRLSIILIDIHFVNKNKKMLFFSFLTSFINFVILCLLPKVKYNIKYSPHRYNRKNLFMLAKSYSFGLMGIDAYLITIEIDTSKGLPSVTIVGLPDNAVRESKERVRSAIRHVGLEFPKGRITINLAPADIKKQGPFFDLPIALGLLAASEQINANLLYDTAFLGELSLDGQIKPIAGALAATMAAKENGFKKIFLPFSNAMEGAITPHISVYSVSSLKETLDILLNSQQQPIIYQESSSNNSKESLMDFQDVKGQSHVKRGLEIAAAGGHNVILIGPPGTGKTMLARRFPSILPDMNLQESLEVTKIYSAHSINKSISSGLMKTRPFRSPHHSSSSIALVGGGSDPKPGEITLAHHGVLFLDELPEFTRHAIETLRQPLEDGFVTIARANKTLQFPAQFTLLAAMNPCPCGYLTSKTKRCSCSSVQIQKYLSKISGPLLDRIDIHLEVPALKTNDLLNLPQTESSSDIRHRVIQARHIQNQRFKDSKITTNSRMHQKSLSQHCLLNPQSQHLIKNAIETMGLSARAYDKILRIARTIADLSNKKEIQQEHLAESISYRTLDKINL